ncbi:hypothetical protein [Gracilibacillus alcaliphilus]|uniref:hypothetical protein n=1 Tax=Gracilibacillus alcaliphilus TaxID=1401441 RepID=UPI00195C4DC9|nr:hypothetical protein [Gracilibacillus alcaliphilus]MBM7675335.1 hypothetical protein [Gracilibacillus alcaliphilus]
MARQPTVSARDQAAQTLENSMAGLSTQTLSCEVMCDEHDRIEWLSIIIPNNASRSETMSQEGQITHTTISLSFTDTPPTIIKPDVNRGFPQWSSFIPP